MGSGLHMVFGQRDAKPRRDVRAKQRAADAHDSGHSRAADRRLRKCILQRSAS